jgi:S1-C subfamily serine protease
VSISTTATIASQVGPAVIGLRAGSRGGSGVIVAPGVAVTLARNIRRDELTVRVGESDLAARVTGCDPTVDLAVLILEGPDLPEPIEWAIGEDVTIGSEVYALADPAGRGLRVTPGTVSRAPCGLRGPSGRLIEGVIEHTAPLPRGSGGGPLVDAHGRILGLNAIRRDGGLIVAWPAAALRDRAAALASGRATAPPRLGVALVSARQASRLRAAVGLEPIDGLLVQAVEPGSPADRAGIARGDVIVAIDETAVSDPDPLYAALDAANRGDITLKIVRGSQEVVLTARLGDDS